MWIVVQQPSSHRVNIALEQIEAVGLFQDGQTNRTKIYLKGGHEIVAVASALGAIEKLIVARHVIPEGRKPSRPKA